MAGVPFEVLASLATPATTQAARELLVREAEFTAAKSEVEKLLQSRKHGLPEKLFRAWRRAIREGAMPPPGDWPSSAFALCWDRAANLANAEKHLEQSLQSELPVAREALFATARRFLPSYLVFAAPGVRDQVIRQLTHTGGPLQPRNKQARADERHWLLYLQRICAKNDSLSEFGPEGWGTSDRETADLKSDPDPGIAGRETFLERWTAHGAAAAVNADAEVRAELAPRLHPNGRIEGGEFIFSATSEAIPLEPQMRAILNACDGVTPAHSLGVEMETLAALAEQNLIRWELEVPALDPYAFAILVADVARWRDGPVRTRWLERLQPIAALPAKFAATTDTLERVALIDEATSRLEKLGAQKVASRFLYSATNPIGEECFRECRFTIGEQLLDEVTQEAAPWIDLWRDNYAFVASRVAAGLRGLLEKMPRSDCAVPLPAFLRYCAQMKMPLTGPGMVAFAHLAFQEVKGLFRARLSDRADLPEYELTAQDCHIVRENFTYEKFDEFTYPSADLQLAAESVEAVARGDYQWILAEMHPSAASLHHGFYWSCPDKPALSAALAQALCGKPNLHFGYFAADFTATTTVRVDALPGLTKFAAPERSVGNWQSFSPAETEVFIDEQTGDVGLRRRGSQEYLGSFARSWVTPLGFHPFSFSLGRNTPRLRCGNVIVQRRSWTVALEELGAGDFTGVSKDLVSAVERLRAARDLPRHVYIRPTEQALRRSGAEGRDKDTKPVFVDLESYMFLEIFHRWLNKAGELEVTEMLPRPDQLLWQEPDGRRTFELRTLIVPRKKDDGESELGCGETPRRNLQSCTRDVIPIDRKGVYRRTVKDEFCEQASV